MKIEIVHKHYHEYDHRVVDLLQLVISKLNKIMTKEEQVLATLQGINEATNDIAADITALKDQIAAGTVTDETIAGLEAAAERLKGIAAETPNPPAEETPAPEA